MLAAAVMHASGAQQVDGPDQPLVQPCPAPLQHFPPAHAPLQQSEPSMQS